jgi:hypothetical protein
MASFFEDNKTIVTVFLVILLGGGVIGGLYFAQVGGSPQQEVASSEDLSIWYWFGGGGEVEEGDTGYAQVRLVLVNGTEVNGTVAVLNSGGDALRSSIGTGISNPVAINTTFEAPENAICTVYNITTSGINNSKVLPASIYLSISSSQSSPQTNTIIVPYMRDSSDVNVSIDQLDSVAGDYNESDLSADTEYDIRYNFTGIDFDNSYDGYGLNCWVPELYLPELSQNESLGGYGLFAYFVNASITGTTKLDDFPTGAWNITSGDLANGSIALLDPVFVEESTQTLTITLDEAPDEIGIFEGFLGNYTLNKIQIT